MHDNGTSSFLGTNGCSVILIGLFHVRHHILSQLLPTLVSALVLSRIPYCLSVYGKQVEKNITPAKNYQFWATRCVRPTKIGPFVGLARIWSIWF